MPTLILRMVLKCLGWMRAAALANPGAVRASRGFEGVLGLLESVDGQDAVGLLRAEGARVGTRARILRGLVIHNAEPNFAKLSIGDDCHVGRQAFFDLASPIRIGNRVTISMRVMLLTHTNVGDSQCGLEAKSAGIDIDDDVYVGAGATVLPGISIGSGAIIAAGAVVTRDVPPATLVMGVPGRPQPTSASRSSSGSNE